MTIVNYISSIVKKLKALLTDDARVVIYDHHVFIVQATGQIIFPTDFASQRVLNGRDRALDVTSYPG